MQKTYDEYCATAQVTTAQKDGGMSMCGVGSLGQRELLFDLTPRDDILIHMKG